MSQADWNEVAPGVFHRRYDPVDVSVVAITGPTGVTIVDTRNNPAEADEIITDVREDFGLPIVAVVNTHAHYDHTFGNQRFAASSIPIYGHHLIPRHFVEHEGPRLAAQQADPTREPDKNWSDVELTPPTHLVARHTTIELAGRTVELIPLGPGHTDTDLVVLVPDARVWILGDIIEESGPPMYGSGSFPLAWPEVLTGLLDWIEPSDRLIPGHGAVVDRDFVARQSAALRQVADRIRSNWVEGVPVDHAYAASPGSPWPSTMLEPAVRRGYQQLDGGD